MHSVAFGTASNVGTCEQDTLCVSVQLGNYEGRDLPQDHQDYFTSKKSSERIVSHGRHQRTNSSGIYDNH